MELMLSRALLSPDLVTPVWSWAPQIPPDMESEPLKQVKQENKCKQGLMSHVDKIAVFF